jgi:hypothetical protein
VFEAVASDPNSYFLRAEVVRLEEEMREAMADVWQLGVSLRENMNAGRFPRNPDSCVSYGRTCQYFGVCSGEASLDDPALFRRSEVAHPELSDNADARLLTSSRLKTARACQRLHKFRYIDMARPTVEPEALRFGTLIHLGLQAWWEARDGDRLGAALRAISSDPAVSHAA